MNKIIKKGQAVFEPRARLLKLLGGELIRDDVMALVELIKNAHDADASTVRVEFSDTIYENGEITVSDDGTGMSIDQLLNHWMQPAGSSKRLNGQRSPGGRRYLGEKGVGRFAVDRLGSCCEIVTRTSSSDKEVVATFDWDAFDTDDAFLRDIEVDWLIRKAPTGVSQGTKIRIKGLRNTWKKRSFRRLCGRAHRLMSPFSSEDSKFSVEIISNDFPDYSAEIAPSFFDNSPYRLKAEFDGKNAIRIQFNGEDDEIYWPGPGYLDCGPVSISLHAFDLESDSLKRVGPVVDVRSWLKEWAGISIYRDGFRVLPYGEPDDDWLRLDQRRVNNPVVRLSNNQIAGVVTITGDQNPELVDQTNRLGLFHNKEFDDLRRLMMHVLDVMELRRQKLRNPRANAKVASAPSAERSVETVFRSIRQHAPTVSKQSGFALGESLDELSRAYGREKNQLLNSLEKHMELSAVGHNTLFMFSSLTSILKDLSKEVSSLEKNCSSVDFKQLSSLVLAARESLNFAEPAHGVLVGAIRELDLIRELREFSRSVSGIGAHEGVLISEKLPAEGVYLVKGKQWPLWQILMALFQNSVQAMGRADHKEVRIGLKKSRNGQEFVVTIRDRGHGVREEIEGRIFESGYTTRRGARGMGLAIAKTLAMDMNAELKFSNGYTSYGWTTFELRFPLAPIIRGS